MVSFLWSRFSRGSLSLLRSGWLLFGGALALFVALEVTAAISLRAFAPAAGPRNEQAPLVYKSSGAPQQEWHPYVYWRTRPFSSPNLNVGKGGLRRTWNAAPEDPAPHRVFMFGASTLRGHGARDDFTIPSLTSRILAQELDVPVVVTNLGQKGYVSTQDLIALILELRKENLPDVVVFYDGAMDIEAAYHSQVPGITHYESYRRHAFEAFETAALVRLARRSSLVELGLRYVTGWDWSLPGVWRPPNGPDGFAPLAAKLVRIYAANVRISEALADGYGFDILHYWQPVIWSREPLTSFEQWVVGDTDRQYPMLDSLFEEVYTRVEADLELNANPRFVNASNLLDGAEDPAFWDAIHTTEAANALIAARIAEDLREVLQ